MFLSMFDHQLNKQQNTTTCELMLQELQEIWDEVGESEPEKDSMLIEIENQCLELYRTKLDEAIKCRAKMLQDIAKIRAEISRICSVLGDQSPLVVWKAVGGLKSELEAIVPQLETMRKRKSERKSQLIEALNELVQISNELGRSVDGDLYDMIKNETDLSLKLLKELRSQLVDCHAEKRDRSKKAEDQLCILKSFCLVLGMDFKHLVDEINPALIESNSTKDISMITINGLTASVATLSGIKMKRWEKLQNLATSLIELWNLMDIPMEEQKMFHNLTSNIAASVSEVTESDMLSNDFLDQVEAEVSRLEKLKSSKMNDLIAKKRSELDDIRRQSHIVATEETTESDTSDEELVLEQIELRIARAKEEALSRRELLERVEKWMTACQEECWLEEYNKDDKRFHAGRGAHLTLKRAEKARAMISKIPAMVELLISRTTAWEAERGIVFLYDGEQLLNMLEQYNISRQEKEREKKKRREQKKLQGQLIAEKEVLYGTKPSPTSSAKKGNKTCSKINLSRTMIQNRKPDKTSKDESLSQKSLARHNQCGCFVVPLSSSSSFAGDKNKARETELSPLKQKPLFGFLSPKASSMANIIENNTPQDKAMIIADRENYGLNCTPLNAIVVDFDGIKTPTTMPIPLPNTPSTACKSEEGIEYSFEEVRANFVCPEYIWD